MTNAHWGYWDGLADDTDHGRRGALCKKSTNLGDGGWCVKCLVSGLYSWVDRCFCQRCKTKNPELTNMDKL